MMAVMIVSDDNNENNGFECDNDSGEHGSVVVALTMVTVMMTEMLMSG